MKTFSMSAAVAEPFRLAFKRPLMTLVWGLVQLLPTLLVIAAAAPLMSEACSSFAQSVEMSAATPASAGGGETVELIEVVEAEPMMVTAPDFEAVMWVQALSWLSNLVQLLCVLLVTTAIARAVFAGRRGDGAAFLRIGRDEVYVAVIGVTVFVAAIVAVVLFFALGMGVAFGLAQVDGPWRWLIGCSLLLAAFLAFLLLWGRLALLAPTAVLRRDLAFEEGWRIGRRQTWKLLGLMLILFVIAIALAIAVVILLFIVIAMLGGAAAFTDAAWLEDDAAVEAWLSGLTANPWPLIVGGLVLLLPVAWIQGFSQLLFTASYARVVNDLATDPAPISTDAPAASE